MEVRAGIPGRNLEEELKKKSWRRAFYWLTQPALIKASRTTSPDMAPPTVSWTLPHQLLIKKMLIDLPIGQCDGDISQLRFPLPK